jgi:hypothetical protein
MTARDEEGALAGAPSETNNPKKPCDDNPKANPEVNHSEFRNEHDRYSLLRDVLPSEIVAAPRWLLWRLHVTGRGKKRVPYYADGTVRQDELDAPDDVARLVTLDKALAALKASKKFDGLGFALGAGFQGIDLDDHRNPDTGELTD